MRLPSSEAWGLFSSRPLVHPAFSIDKHWDGGGQTHVAKSPQLLSLEEVRPHSTAERTCCLLSTTQSKSIPPQFHRQAPKATELLGFTTTQATKIERLRLAPPYSWPKDPPHPRRAVSVNPTPARQGLASPPRTALPLRTV